MMFFPLRGKKTRPEPRFGSGRTNQCPWFHLNSPLDAGHFVPGNGGDRRSISAPLLKGAFPPRPVKARTNRLFSGPGAWKLLFPVNAVSTF